MKGIKNKYRRILEKLNLKPFKTVVLKTGVICKHYMNGNVKVI